MKIKKNIPIYKLTINDNDESGVYAVALVERPAIESDWFAFSKREEKKFEFKTINEDKQLLAGYAMIPDKLIYRNVNGNEFYVVFDAEQIEKISEKYNKKLLMSNFNIGHNDKNKTNAYVKENWIVTSEEYDKSISFGFDAVVGGWFMITKVEDPDVWKQIKEKKLKGYSVEGLFDMEIEKFMTNINLAKIGFDYDQTLSTAEGKKIAQEFKDKNDELYIVTARNENDDNSDLFSTAESLGINKDHIFFTNGKDKFETVGRIGLDKFFDNNIKQVELININTETKAYKFNTVQELFYINKMAKK